MTESPLCVRELNHIAFYVRDLARSITFYETVLGFARLDRPPFDFDGAWFGLGGQQLHLIVDTMNRDKDRHSLHVAFVVDDALLAHSALAASGIVGLSAPQRRPDGVIQVFLPDPDGYRLEFMSWPKNRPGLLLE